MQRILLSIFVFFITASGFSQTLNGQWRGVFDSNGDIILSGDNTTEYVLELNVQGKKITGYSYSYFNNRQYFVICALSGTYNKATRTIDVLETRRIKGVTPPDWNDCLQEHLLTYTKQGNTEVLTGIWRSANSQLSDCGTGFTTLSRTTYSKDLATTNSPGSSNNSSNNNSSNNKVKGHVEQAKTSKHIDLPVTQTEQKDSVKVPLKPDSATAIAAVPDKIAETDNPVPSDITYEKRINQILRTIEIDSATFNVDLYDNGAIDGDSISLFYNGKVIFSHRRLSEKAISITLSMNTGDSVNELTMYAENLGEIPPNTALMVITDGKNRYEVNVSSDLTTSGSIRFIHNTPTTATPPTTQ